MSTFDNDKLINSLVDLANQVDMQQTQIDKLIKHVKYLKNKAEKSKQSSQQSYAQFGFNINLANAKKRTNGSMEAVWPVGKKARDVKETVLVPCTFVDGDTSIEDPSGTIKINPKNSRYIDIGEAGVYEVTYRGNIAQTDLIEAKDIFLGITLDGKASGIINDSITHGSLCNNGDASIYPFCNFNNSFLIKLSKPSKICIIFQACSKLTNVFVRSSTVIIKKVG